MTDDEYLAKFARRIAMRPGARRWFFFGHRCIAFFRGVP